jgi:hypothetical protein
MIAMPSCSVLITLVYVLRRAFVRQAGEICGWSCASPDSELYSRRPNDDGQGLEPYRFRVLPRDSRGGSALQSDRRGDGTIKGRVQMYVCTRWASPASLLAADVYFACRSLSNEIAAY